MATALWEKLLTA